MVSRKSGAVARRTARTAGCRMAGASRHTPSGRPRERAGDVDIGAAVYRLPARLPRRTLRHEPAAAGPLPDPRQSGGIAGTDLRAAGPAGRQRPRWLAVGDDAAAL